MTTIRRSKPSDGDRLVAIWRSSVDATHDFLSAADREAIDAEVRSFLPAAAVLLAVDDENQGIGFMGLTEGHIESLFIDAEHRGRGLGRRFVEIAAGENPVVSTDVNEQNDQALGFYHHLGFVTVGRSPLDEQGRPYPLLHLRLTNAPTGTANDVRAISARKSSAGAARSSG
jgi:putative acetyltransferase